MKIHIVPLLVLVLLHTAYGNPRVRHHHALKAKNHQVRSHESHEDSALNTTGAGFQLFYNDSIHLLAFVESASASRALVFDCGTGYFASINGEEGITTAVDIKNQKVFQINGSKPGVWNKTQQDFKAFFQTLEPFRIMLHEYSPASTLPNMNEATLKEINHILKHFHLADFHHLTAISEAARLLPADFLKWLLHGRSGSNITSPVGRVIFILQNFGKIFTDLPDGFRDLIKQGTDVDVGQIFNSSSVSEIWMSFLEQISSRVDLTKSFGNLAKNARAFFDVVTQSVGRDCSISQTIQKLGDPAQHAKNVNSTINILQKLRKIIDNQNDKYHNSTGLKSITSMLSQISQRPFVEEALNIPRSIIHMRFREALRSFVRLVVRIVTTMNPLRMVSHIINFLAKRGILPGLIPTNLQDLMNMVQDGQFPIEELCEAVKRHVNGVAPQFVQNFVQGGLNILGLDGSSTTPKPDDDKQTEDPTTELPTQTPEDKALKMHHKERRKNRAEVARNAPDHKPLKHDAA